MCHQAAGKKDASGVFKATDRRRGGRWLSCGTGRWLCICGALGRRMHGAAFQHISRRTSDKTAQRLTDNRITGQRKPEKVL